MKGPRWPGDSTRCSKWSSLATYSSDTLAAVWKSPGRLTPASDLVAHVIYLAAALEGRLMQDALVYRDDGGIVADHDVTGMLQHLHFNDDGSMAFADIEGAKELFYHDCDDVTARWAFERLTPECAGDTATTPISVKRFWEADLPRSFIICLQDRAQPRWLSRPAELAQLLIEATTTEPVGPLRPDG
jgi:hypothetical protein